MDQDKLQHCDYWTIVGNKRYLQVQDVSTAYFSDVVEGESFTDQALAAFDKNKDGQIDEHELRAAKDELESKGINFAALDVKQREKEHVAQTESLSNIGPQAKLENRYEVDE